MSGRALPHMGTLVSALFAFGARADVSPFLGCGSPLLVSLPIVSKLAIEVMED